MKIVWMVLQSCGLCLILYLQRCEGITSSIAGRELLSEPALRLAKANFRTNVRLCTFYGDIVNYIDKSRETW